MKEWEGMPEFVQKKKEPFSKVVVRFETEKRLRRLCKINRTEINASDKEYLASV